LALQLYLVKQGLTDTRLGAPVDAVLVVEPALDGAADVSAKAAWCGQLMQMYRGWATRRHMQLDEHSPPKGGGPTILQIGGFGAFHTLVGEAGLHVLEEPELEDGRRTAARVRVVAGPWVEPKETEAYREFTRLLSNAAEANAVVRRYRVG